MPLGMLGEEINIWDWLGCWGEEVVSEVLEDLGLGDFVEGW